MIDFWARGPSVTAEFRLFFASGRRSDGSVPYLEMRMARGEKSLGNSVLRGEQELLAQIRSRVRARAGAKADAKSGVALGIGDDCALLRLQPGEELAVTTDLSIDERHFRLTWHPPESVGHRALARGLSDLAAMGARPVAAFLSLGLPAHLVPSAKTGRDREAWVARFFAGLLALTRAHGVPLAGGDLAESPIAVADIVLTGAVRRGRALLRSGARPGDALYVTGSLGGAAAGLRLLEELAEQRDQVRARNSKQTGRDSKRSKRPTVSMRIPARLPAALAAHLYPQPRVAQGLALVRRGLASAAMDLSDGLSTDLHHLCEESDVAAEVDAAALPIADGATLEDALHGGEDYELLFAASEGTRMPRALSGVPVTRVGRVMRRRRNGPVVTLVDAGGSRALEARGWEHFS
jgi:thiamine-monophosphate kinase